MLTLHAGPSLSCYSNGTEMSCPVAQIWSSPPTTAEGLFTHHIYMCAYMYAPARRCPVSHITVHFFLMRVRFIRESPTLFDSISFHGS